LIEQRTNEARAHDCEPETRDEADEPRRIARSTTIDSAITYVPSTTSAAARCRRARPSGFSSTAETSAHVATAAPMPHASAATEAIVVPASLRRRRTANLRSSNRSVLTVPYRDRVRD